MAWNDKRKIFADELTRYLARIPAHQLREYASLEKKTDLLKNLIRLEVLAEMAIKEGLDKDPDVLLAMKTEMVKKYLMTQFNDEKKVTVSDEEIKAAYDKNVSIYNKPTKVRASQIKFKDKAKADQVLIELRAELEKPGAEAKRLFREFAKKYSEDDVSRRRGGDLLYFTKDGKTDGNSVLDMAVVNAAFMMQNPDQVSEVVQGADAWYIVSMTSRREGVEKSIDEVKETIRSELAQEKLEAMRRQFTQNLVNFDEWYLEADEIDKVIVEGMPASQDLKARAAGSDSAPQPVPITVEKEPVTMEKVPVTVENKKEE